MKRILKSKLPELWELINTHFDLFLPMEQGSLINFGAYSPVSYTHLTLPTICSV